MGKICGYWLWLWVILLISSLALSASAQQPGPGIAAAPQVQVNVQTVIQQFPAASGQVNWTAGLAQATGSGAPPIVPGYSEAQRRLMAKRAAVLDAQRNLAETIHGVRITAQTTVNNYVVQDDSIRSSLEAFIQGARVIAEKPLADGSYEVTVALDMYGDKSISQAVMPAVLEQERVIESPPETVYLPSAPPAPLVPEPVPASPPPMGPFTGLIIDCRGMRVSPALSPKIVDNTGKELWGTMQIDPETAIERGIVGYYATLEDARRSSRAGNNPLIIKAIGNAGIAEEFKFNAVVSEEDGEYIRRENENTRFLEKLNVCFVVN